MNEEELRLKKIQEMAYLVMDEMNFNRRKYSEDILKQAVDLLARAVGMFADPSRNFSLDYIEEKVMSVYTLIINSKKLSGSIKKSM